MLVDHGAREAARLRLTLDEQYTTVCLQVGGKK